MARCLGVRRGTVVVYCICKIYFWVFCALSPLLLMSGVALFSVIATLFSSRAAIVSSLSA